MAYAVGDEEALMSAQVCKGCSKALDDGEVRLVGGVAFCQACLDDLLGQAERRKHAPPPAPVVAEPPLAASIVADTVTCRTCKIEVAEVEAASWLGMYFCKKCHKVLEDGMRELRTAPLNPPLETPDPTVQVAEQVELDPGVILCDGCGRQIMARASKLKEDQRLCPDCFFGKSTA